jgi:hypothetical protein
MIPLDNILTGVWTWLNNDTTLRTICGDSGRIVKGPKRPDDLSNPCITVAMPSRSHPYDWAGATTLLKTSQEPILIACFADTHDNNAIDVAQLSTMASRVHTLAATSKPTIAGAGVSRLGSYTESGPVYDASDPDEAYQVISLSLWVRDAV